MAAVFAAWSSTLAAREPEPLDADFLDYLISYEGKDDNWTVVAREEDRDKGKKEKKPEEKAEKPEKEKPVPPPESQKETKP